MSLPPTQVAYSIDFDKTDGILLSTDVMAILLELRLKSRTSNITAAACLIKTQRIVAEMALRDQTI